MTPKELCVECDEPTGKAGRCEDSLYLYAVSSGNEWGPLCEICYQFHAENDGLWTCHAEGGKE